MGKPTGFLEFGRAAAAAPSGAGAAAGLARGLRALRRRGHPAAGRPLHGLRHPLLPRGLPARQPHPRVERPRVPRRLVRRHRAAARHQQLPRVHRPAVPGPMRGGVRARDQRRPGDHRADRVRDRRAGLGRGLGAPQVPAGAPASGWPSSARVRPGWPPPSSWPGPATRSSSSSGPRSRAACCATASPSSRWRRRCSTAAWPSWGPRASTFQCSTSVGDPPADAGDGRSSRGRARRRHGLRARRRRRLGAEVRRGFDAVVLAGGATLPRDLDVPGRDLGGHPLRHGVPQALQPGPGGRAPRRRSRPRASTWSSSAAATPGPTAWAPPTARARRSVHQLEIMPEPPSDRAGRQPLAGVAAHPADVLGPRGGGRAALLGDHHRVRRRRRRRGAGLRATRSRCDRATAGPVFVPLEGTEFELPCDLVLLAMGFVGHRAPRRGRRAGLELDARGAVAADAGWATNVDGRLRVRRHDPGPEPHRVGHRRGPLGRGRRRPLAHGLQLAPRADRAGSTRPALTTWTTPCPSPAPTASACTSSRSGAVPACCSYPGPTATCGASVNWSRGH